MAVGHREDRHPVAGLPHVGVGRDALGDQQCRVAGPRDLVVPQCPHLGSGLEEVAVAVELEPVGVRQCLAGLDTQQRLVVLRSVAGDVVAVVGGQRRNVEFAPDLQQSLADAPLDVEAVIHQFEEEVLRSEDLAPPRCGFQRLALVSESQPGLHLARRAPGGGDDALGVLGDHLGIHPRPLAELALERGQRGELEQIAQPGGALGDHGHVRVGAAARDVVRLLARIAPEHPLGVETRRRGDVGLDPDDRFDAGVCGGVVELAGTEHVSVIGHPDRGHLQPLRLGQHGLDLRGTVEHRILGVVVQMHKRP